MTSIIYKFTNNSYDGLYFLKGQIISSNLINEVFVIEKCSFRKGPRQSTFNFGTKQILFVENNMDYALDDYDTYIISILNSLPTLEKKNMKMDLLLRVLLLHQMLLLQLNLLNKLLIFQNLEHLSRQIFDNKI